MTLEISLRQFSLLPLFAQDDEKPSSPGMKPRIHWVGQKPPAEQGQEPGGKRGGSRAKKKDPRGYRELASITLGEVSEAYKFYAPQLTPSPAPMWIASNYFCMMHLQPRRDTRPPALFGRIQTCYPSDGYAQNLQELEILVPNRERQPDVVHLQARDILNSGERPLQSYCVRVKFLTSPEDQADFAGSEQLFWKSGFMPEFSAGYIDLLDASEQNHASLPWLYVVGSRWFASIPASMQPEIREKLTRMLQWRKLIFNYHPEHLPREVRTLNRELGFKAGYTDIFLIEPENPEQTVQIIAKAFDKLFSQPIQG